MNRGEINGAALRDITRRYYAMWWGYAFAGGFLYGVYPLFLRSRGLDQFEMNSVLACYFVVMFLTDVPTGAFADAMGRRRSFVLGCATRVAARLTSVTRAFIRILCGFDCDSRTFQCRTSNVLRLIEIFELLASIR